MNLSKFETVRKAIRSYIHAVIYDIITGHDIYFFNYEIYKFINACFVLDYNLHMILNVHISYNTVSSTTATLNYHIIKWDYQ